MRGIMRWALKNELIKTDPTANLTASRPKTNGIPEWTEEEISAFQPRWPLGTRERVAFDVLFYTGLRRGDAAVFGRQHIKDNVARLTTEKTGAFVSQRKDCARRVQLATLNADSPSPNLKLSTAGAVGRWRPNTRAP